MALLICDVNMHAAAKEFSIPIGHYSSGAATATKTQGEGEGDKFATSNVPLWKRLYNSPGCSLKACHIKGHIKCHIALNNFCWSGIETKALMGLDADI